MRPFFRPLHSFRPPLTPFRLRPQPQQLLRHSPRRPYSTPSPDPTPNLGSPPAQSLTQRLKKLSREYGWTAVGVYFALSALDFPFCFAAVRIIGTDRIGYAEQKVVGWVRVGLNRVAPNLVAAPEALSDAERWGVEKAQKANSEEDASIWTQLALAYAIHKSFIFVRVPLTAAVLPKVVKTLRGWGWNIGKRKPTP